ncbi:JOSEPHIN-like protein [Wolffia australiana]
MGGYEERPFIYHERQRLQFCLLHALNNLFQEREESFSRAELDAIAEKLCADDTVGRRWSPLSRVFRPHHNRLTGNYDVNVLMAAAGSRGRRVTWHDRRRGAAAIGLDGPDEPAGLEGLMLNVPARRLGGLWSARHWLAVRRVHGRWYDLDSDLPEPRPLDAVGGGVHAFLGAVLSRGGEILLVLR